MLISLSLNTFDRNDDVLNAIAGQVARVVQVGLAQTRSVNPWVNHGLLLIGLVPLYAFAAAAVAQL
jgi:hypothetical protein